MRGVKKKKKISPYFPFFFLTISFRSERTFRVHWTIQGCCRGALGIPRSGSGEVARNSSSSLQFHSTLPHPTLLSTFSLSLYLFLSLHPFPFFHPRLFHSFHFKQLPLELSFARCVCLCLYGLVMRFYHAIFIYTHTHSNKHNNHADGVQFFFFFLNIPKTTTTTFTIHR